MIGHNPGLQDCALFVTGSGAADQLEALHLKFPTAGLAVIDFPVAQWSGIGRRGGRLERFSTPRGLAAEASR